MKSKRRAATFPTLQLIADKANLSRGAVSHILGGKFSDRYGEKTRAKVLEIASELNYRPHRGAQAMKAGRTNLVAIVHFGADVEAARKTNFALARLINERGYDYLAMDMSWFGGSMERTLAEIIRARVEGVLISHIQEVFRDEHIAELQRAGIPVVSVNGGRRPNVPLIGNNSEKAFAEMAGHLFEQGHRRLVQLSPALAGLDPERVPNLSGKITGFRRAVEQRGVWREMAEEEFFATWPGMTRELSADGIFGVTVLQDVRLYERVDKPVYRFCKNLFSRGVRPDALVCTNDFYAMELIAAGLEHGVQVPRHLAVTGYDNDGIGQFPAFGLTTAEQDLEGICSAALDGLMERIAEPDAPVQDRLFDSRLVIRTSSGKGDAPAPAATLSPDVSVPETAGVRGVDHSGDIPGFSDTL